jgi:hypothetical protein
MTVDAIRKTVPLTAGELAILDAARTAGTTEHQALLDLAGAGADKSEAAALRALLSLGIATLEDRVAEQGYRELAAVQTEEDRAFHEAMRSRRRRTGDGE